TDTVGLDKITWETFLTFYHMLTNRLEVEKVFCSLTDQSYSANKKTKLRGMTVEQLVTFLNEEQRDPRLNEILYPYADAPKAVEVIRDYEPHKENITKNVLSCEGFLKYLMSKENTVMSMEKLDQYEDMDQPLGHYFINSSHNTYLTGHQFTGKSSVEMYRQCLLAGCRCVELDFWNGRLEEPVIVHGFTLVPEISAKEVIEGIAESAFKTSEWPVILSFENHCNPRQQAKIAGYCREFFGDMLLDSPLENYLLEPGHPLPPPSSLKRKIIIKNKKKHRTHHHSKRNTPGGDSQFHVELNQTGESRPTEMQGNGEIPRPLLEKEGSRESSEEENEVANGEIPDGGPEDVVSSSSDEEELPLTPEEIHERDISSPGHCAADAEEEAGAEISALVNYVQPVHFHSFEAAEKRNRSYEMSSFVETQSSNLLKETPMEFVNYNKRQLSRVYPRGTRVDSSNFLPHQFWNAGCQLVALNYQTLDLAMQLNLGIFEFNNRSGYLLKPDFMRRPDRRFDPFAESTVDGIIAGTVSVKVISGQFLSDKRAGCYVEVEMYGLPADTVRKRFRTKTVPNNCINPVWDEEPFVFKKVVLPELATIRIVAYEEGGRGSLGNRVLPIVGLRPGYKHITLRNEAGQPLGIATLFVHVKVGDYVPHGLSDFAEALANPIKYQSELEKRTQQLSQEGGVGEPPHTPVKKNDSKASQGVGGEGSLTVGDDGQNKASRTKSNGEVPDTTSAAHESTPIGARLQCNKDPPSNTNSMSSPFGPETSQGRSAPKVSASAGLLAALMTCFVSNRAGRQNSVSAKAHLNTKTSEEKPDREKEGSVTLLETSKHLIEAEGLDKLLNYKSVKEKRVELEKSIDKLRKKYEKIFTALEKAMKMSQAAQLKTLQTLHDKQVDDIKRKTEEQHREKRKGLVKTVGGDKEELSRKKREISKQIVAEGIQERQRLTDIHDKKKAELEKQQEEIRNQYEEEKQRARNAIETEFEEKRRKLEESITS
ncbi:1-phosphatidylinositol 45-bisphosphate phosphodiesterase beta-3-like, partial [Homarus americanus]